jgi:hypothetical protein
MLNKGVWRKINQQKNFGRLLFFIWVWTYKFDENNHLAKYKARFVARDDLQPASKESIYAATLAAKFFRILMACAAQYDLECKQYDVIEAFLNAIRQNSEKLYAELLAGYKKPEKCIKILKAIYGLKDSLLL